ncbi:hypothetical protein ASPTUDRAFT_482789 [Aspergillus tubingensis CBS 134.48]|uniref:Uncharacterized protein n=1 Tax=Aspergillus tubingensis (strain CBS 134.48) TaxID=767770 RepID=A0A1L9NBG7_ASPTC|nr:hypothetical protein ASPTUDRAFT_482789 [Aspergillus tubingensis CBS 134.48]
MNPRHFPFEAVNRIGHMFLWPFGFCRRQFPSLQLSSHSSLDPWPIYLHLKQTRSPRSPDEWLYPEPPLKACGITYSSRRCQHFSSRTMALVKKAAPSLIGL